MDGKRKLTIGILVATALFLIGYDIVVAVNKEEGDTISEVTLDKAIRYPIIPFALGVVMGHLFWPQKKKDKGR